MSKPTASAAGGAMSAEGRETYAAGFLRLRVLRLSFERTLEEMGAVLDAVDAPPAATPEQRSLLDVDEPYRNRTMSETEMFLGKERATLRGLEEPHPWFILKCPAVGLNNVLNCNSLDAL